MITHLEEPDRGSVLLSHSYKTTGLRQLDLGIRRPVLYCSDIKVLRQMFGLSLTAAYVKENRLEGNIIL